MLLKFIFKKNTFTFFLIILFCFSYAQAQSIKLNEIMFAANKTTEEFIEIYNSSSQPVNIQDYKIVYDDNTPDVIISDTDEYEIPPESYAVIFEGDYDFENGVYKNIIPSNTLVFVIDNNSFGSRGMANSSDRKISLLNSTNDTIDVYTYSADNDKGYSDERVDADDDLWQNSKLFYGTPGRINSVTSKEYDLVIVELFTTPEFPTKDEEIYLNAKIKNFGLQIADNFSVDFYYVQENETIFLESQNFSELGTDDSLIVTSENSILIDVTLTIKSKINFIDDLDTLNNSLSGIVIPGFNNNTILLTEVYFKNNSNEPQWIELLNNSDITINLKDWFIADSKEKVSITEDDLFLEPNDYLVLTEFIPSDYFDDDITVIQTNIPYLNFGKDEITIYDFRDALIDRMKYEVENNFPLGYSLEKIDLNKSGENIDNWTYCINNKANTAGFDNSTFSIPDYNFGDVIINEIMFDPNDDNSEFIEIYNTSNENINLSGWKISDEEDELIFLGFKPLEIKANSYFVIAADSLIFNYYSWLDDDLSILNRNSLNLANSGKKIYLKDLRNNIIDSINYKPKWHNTAFEDTKNISLELINPNLNRNTSSNWSSSVSSFGATPGKENSIKTNNAASETKLEISPNPFSPDNDGIEDFALINYNLKESISQIRIRVFDSQGRFIKTITENQPTGSKGSIVFDGLDKNNNPLKIGIYIILFEAVNSNNSIVETIKKVVVIAKKL